MSTTSFKAGQHIRASRFLYWHHGIFWGVDTHGVAWVIAAGTPMSPHAIGYVTLAAFHGQGRVEPVNHETSYPPEEVLQRAISRIGESRYGVLDNNCEHFANWCVTGKHESAQAQLIGVAACIALFALFAGAVGA